MMKGCKKLKPSDMQRKNPFTIVHVRKACNGLLLVSVLNIGYSFRERVGDHAQKSRDQWQEVIRPKDLTFMGPEKKPKPLKMDFRQHKTNKRSSYSWKSQPCLFL